MKLRAIVYPNNEVRVALYPEKLPQDCFKSASIQSESRENHPGVNQSDSTLITLDSSPIERGRAFNIKSKVDTRVRKLKKALSRYGKRQILRAGSCFSKDGDSERLLLTGTLPGSSYKAFRALSVFSTYATKTLSNWITRRSPGAAWMYVWEFQKRGALHVHFVVELPIAAAKYVKEHFKDQWNRILRSICKLSGADLFAKTEKYSHSESKTQADVTVCDREPSRYISKYISKGSHISKAFGQFPPKVWYQISRSLLRRLRDATITYEVEGLSYRQARKCEEDAISYLSNHAIAGYRRFDGACYAWSGYCYVENFKPSELSPMLEKKNQYLLSTQQMASLARATMKDYPGGSCYVRAATHPKTFELMEARLLSETELLLYIESVTRTLSETIESEWNKYKGAHYLVSINNWWRSKYSYDCVQPSVIAYCVKICELNLTGKTSRTKLDKQQLKLNIV